MPPLHVHGLDRFVDAVHAQFDAWSEDESIAAAIGPDGLALLRLAAHEWVANLVQHADFDGPAELVMSVEVVGDGLRCAIQDSSSGFDFVRQVDAQQSMLEEPMPSERGRGLLMLVSCAEDLSFSEATAEAPQQIAFTVRAPGEDLFASLFRPEDLALDLSETSSSSSQKSVEARGDGASQETTPLPVHQESISS